MPSLEPSVEEWKTTADRASDELAHENDIAHGNRLVPFSESLSASIVCVLGGHCGLVRCAFLGHKGQVILYGFGA
jgi:hypothetical protein